MSRAQSRPFAAALALVTMSFAPGCVVFGEYSPYEVGDEPDDPIIDLIGDRVEPFNVWEHTLPPDTVASDGWTFDPTQRHVGGIVQAPDGLRSATLSLTTATGGALDSLDFSTPWTGELTSSPKRIWLDGEGVDWIAWRSDDTEYLGLRGTSELTLIDDVEAAGVDAWLGDEELVLTACGDGGLRVFTTSLDGTIRTDEHIDTPGDHCAIMAPFGEPMVLLGSSAGGPLVRWRVVDGMIVDPLVVNADLLADRLTTASSGDVAMFAYADGEQIALVSSWGQTRHVAPASTANWLVMDVMDDGTAAIGWVDAEDTVHAHWGNLGAPLPGVNFAPDAPPLGLAVGLRDEVISVATFDGQSILLGRQLP